ncbi:hypothetical protein [Diaphorobacter caeni]|uniref:hypothetical protein n=1 Tax=Diaphorobacter caeni TaxID=2784387 RepID=UPI00188FDD4C|nr:hypothetical protein [Diaphorobacter caeni]MBF5007123.1 hypothetical protein [Diaphorobacter caeni]
MLLPLVLITGIGWGAVRFGALPAPTAAGLLAFLLCAALPCLLLNLLLGVAELTLAEPFGDTVQMLADAALPVASFALGALIARR